MSLTAKIQRPLLISGIAIIFCLTWYFGSPAWTVRQMRQAAEAQNVEGVSAYVDFAAVRESLKGELKAGMAKAILTSNSSNAEMMGATIAMRAVDDMADAMVSPAMFRAMLAKDAKATDPKLPFGLRADGTEFVRDSFDQFRLRQADGAALVFERRGFGWKLVAIRSPVETAVAKSGEAPEHLSAGATPSPADVPFKDAAGNAIDATPASQRASDANLSNAPPRKPVPARQGCIGRWLFVPDNADPTMALGVEVGANQARVQWIDYGNASGPYEASVDKRSIAFADTSNEGDENATSFILTCLPRSATLEMKDENGVRTYRGLIPTHGNLFDEAIQRWGWQPDE